MHFFYATVGCHFVCLRGVLFTVYCFLFYEEVFYANFPMHKGGSVVGLFFFFLFTITIVRGYCAFTV